MKKVILITAATVALALAGCSTNQGGTGQEYQSGAGTVYGGPTQPAGGAWQEWRFDRDSDRIPPLNEANPLRPNPAPAYP